jgi:hypothetical protein
MDENTEVVETPEATIEEKSFGQEIAEALAVGIVSGVGTLAGFYAFGWAASKIEALQARRAAKKAAKDVIETPEPTVNTEE